MMVVLVGARLRCTLLGSACCCASELYVLNQFHTSRCQAQNTNQPTAERPRAATQPTFWLETCFFNSRFAVSLQNRPESCAAIMPTNTHNTKIHIEKSQIIHILVVVVISAHILHGRWRARIHARLAEFACVCFWCWVVFWWYVCVRGSLRTCLKYWCVCSLGFRKAYATCRHTRAHLRSFVV